MRDLMSFGLPLGLTEVAVQSVTCLSHCESITLLQTRIFYSVAKVGSSSVSGFLFYSPM